MIKNIFIPEKIGHYYIFKKTIIGVDIAKSHINFCVVQLRGTQITILNQFEEKIDLKIEDSLVRTQEAFKRGMDRIPHYDEIRTSLSSAKVMYKYVTVPFLQYEKINLILPFEVESMLPFGIQDALIDFVILAQDKEQGTSTILVAAIQKETLEKHLEIFNGTPYNPTVVGADMINIYYLFSLLNGAEYRTKNVILLDFGVQTTTIGFVHQGNLEYIRNIQQGVSHIAKTVGEQLNIPAHQAMEHVIRFGSHKETAPSQHQATQDVLMKFWGTIRFTIQSFLAQTKEQKIDTVFVFGDGATIKNTIDHGSQELGIPFQWLSLSVMPSHQFLIVKHKDQIPNSGLMSVATAIVTPETDRFNLRKGSFAKEDLSQFVLPLMVTIVMTLMIVGSLTAVLLWEQYRLGAEKDRLQREVIVALKKEYPSVSRAQEESEETVGDEFDTCISQAQAALKHEMETLSKFSHKSRGSFIQYLFELTQHIDKRALGFEVDSITMNDKEIIMKARVKDHNALKILENEIRKSELFIVKDVQDPEFVMHIAIKRSLEDSV